ncbi:MAG: hypothetical protein M3442_13390, partial [Chloroflexota bacterium]|nr:hypothetical protein [Chloroflexota bacterium]
GLLGWVWYSCPDVTVTVTPQEFTVKHESGCGGSQTAVYRWTDVTATHYWEEVTGEPGSDARAAPKGAAYFRVDTTAGPAFQMRCAGRTAEVIVAFNELVPSLPYVWQRPGTAGSGRATFSTTGRFTTSSARSGEYVKVQRGAGYALNALA